MEQSNALFSLTIDPVTKAHLTETVKWSRFLSIVGFILCALMALLGLSFGAFMSYFGSGAGNPEAAAVATAGGLTSTITLILIAVLYFFPCLYLYRFSVRMRHALNGNSQQDLNDSFSNLRAAFRFVGIITMVVLALYLLGFALIIAGIAMA
ncbi:MAG TPA: DUF5362 family protein [Chitinophagaceae bacterium]|jgi:hypothetical protein|nr:DUF5362 family protein [Chitinophagaceae bacterium]